MILCCNTLSAQESNDTTSSGEDTIIYKHSPKKAAIFSIILPGLGQVYNKKIWKVPLIYIGFGTLGYFISFNNKEYLRFKSAYQHRYNNDPDFDKLFPDMVNYPLQTLQLGMDTYRRWRDLNGLGFIALYALQVIDANVDAHFFYYDISKDLTMNIRPGFIANDNLLGYAVGLKINLHF